MMGLVSHSGETFRCINMHQAGYSDTTRRKLISENLTRIILDNKSMRYIIGGDMNSAPPGGRDGGRHAVSHPGPCHFGKFPGHGDQSDGGGDGGYSA